MSALAVFGQTCPQRMSAEEVGRNIGSALHAGLAITQGDNRDLEAQRERLKLGAQAIMQAWRDLDVLEIREETEVLTRLQNVERTISARQRPALA
ncbi:hypothetical protein [Asaia sp. HumB]|uniref:hypothetical protein n=1 Tax=Asaia sp. HumB TaxID=3035475 RepID=UPI002557A738|nr:hypothetical protein [Asaia sp. HumB]MDL2169779.1 hypothetical protein [Asaia sp. HumB]